MAEILEFCGLEKWRKSIFSANAGADPCCCRDPPETGVAQPQELGSRVGLGVHECLAEELGREREGKFGFGIQVLVAPSPLLEETRRKGKERLRSAALLLRNLRLPLGPFGSASAWRGPRVDDLPLLTFPACAEMSLWDTPGSPHGRQRRPALLCHGSQASPRWWLNWQVIDLIRGLGAHQSDLESSSPRVA